MNNIGMNMTEEELKAFTEMANKFEKATANIKKLNPDTILLTTHAYARAIERFGMKDNAESLKYFRSLMRKATFISEIVDELGSRTKLYGVYLGDFTVAQINVSLNYEIIVTMLKIKISEYGMPKSVKDTVLDVHKSELKMLNRKESACLKKIDYIIAEANAEIYPLKFEIMKTTSDKKKANYIERIKEVEQHVCSKKQEISDIQTKIRQTARSMTMLVY